MRAQHSATPHASFRGEAPTSLGYTRLTLLEIPWCFACGFWAGSSDWLAAVPASLLWTRGPWIAHDARRMRLGIYWAGWQSTLDIENSTTTVLSHHLTHFSIAQPACGDHFLSLVRIKMRSNIIITSFLAGLAVALPDPTPQGYTGPCSVDNCGVNGLKCPSLCVPWPSTDPALRKGCTCSTG